MRTYSTDKGTYESKKMQKNFLKNLLKTLDNYNNRCYNPVERSKKVKL